MSTYTMKFEQELLMRLKIIAARKNKSLCSLIEEICKQHLNENYPELDSFIDKISA